MNPVAAGGVVAEPHDMAGICEDLRSVAKDDGWLVCDIAAATIESLQQRLTAAQAEADRLRVDAEGAGVDAERREDMSPRGRLRLHAQEDGDMCVMVIEDDGTSAGIEFCNSGGKSPRTLQALRNLSRAMRDDAIHAAKTEQERGE